MERRDFLKTSAVGLVAAAAWTRVPHLARAAPGGPLIELAARPANYESPRDTFTSRITPIDRFYIRNHFDPPSVDAASFRLNIGGLVEKPLSLSLADLEKLPQVTVEAVLQCAGNGRGLFRPRMPGLQWRWGAMGNAEWTGVRFKDVLALARPKAQAKHVQLQGAERPVLEQTPRFIRGIPFEKALHPDTLIALRMNGKALSPQHGFPARLVVPGWVADGWTKWLTDVELRADEPKGFFYEVAYRFPDQPVAPGAAVPPDRMKPMNRLNVKSIVASLAPDRILKTGAHELLGVAFSGEARISRVEVTTDGGRTWQPATLDGPDTAYGFRSFRFPWKVDAPGRYRVASRATDSTGATQPDAPLWNPAGYLYNPVEPVSVEVRA